MLNKVQLIGNLGKDPEVKYMPSGDAVTNITIATTEKWKDKNSGEKKEKTEWHRVVFFGKPAEIIGQYCKKGSKIYIEGKLQTRKWQGQDGQDRYTTEIVVQGYQGSFELLDAKPANLAPVQTQVPAHVAQAPAQAAPAQDYAQAQDDDSWGQDIPF